MRLCCIVPLPKKSLAGTGLSVFVGAILKKLDSENRATLPKGRGAKLPA
jgi:hypothetical protein